MISATGNQHHNNSVTTGPGGSGGALLHQHRGNNGDVQVSNISISNNPRPQSSKITKKKANNNFTGGQIGG